MTFKLYGRRGSGSACVETLLAIANMPHEVVEVPKQEDGTAPSWYLAINPTAQVPALSLPGGYAMTESAAIMIYLADLPACTYRGNRLAPATTDQARAAYLRWMVFLSAAQYEAMLRYFYSARYSNEPAHAAAIQAKATQQVNVNFDRLAEGADKTGPFMFGATLSAVDIYAAMLLGWSADIEALFKRLPRLERLYRATMAEANIRETFTRHDMP